MAEVDQFAEDLPSKIASATILKSGMINPKSYDVDDKYREGTTKDDVHSTPALVDILIKDPKIQVDAKILGYNPKENNFGYTKLNRDSFIEAFKSQKLKESDCFGWETGQNTSQVGVDYVPLLGGPFNKQLYYYDYLRMHALAFHAYHHDPVALRLVHTLRDFTLGRGFRIDATTKKGRALVRMVEDANQLPEMMDYIAREISIYGENMLWELPGNESRITYNLGLNQKVPTAPIPRFRVIDPSCIWEIVTYPEDITRVLYYQWVAQTQYQMYTGRDQGSPVPSSKFIIRQIPGGEIIHTKINCVSNEKRGRSDLFPILGFLKRLRDSVDYSIISMQKASAWSIDTAIKGSQTDIDNYIASINSQGQFAPPGSEFVHTEAITRTYLSNAATSRSTGNNSAFDWTLNMIAMGFGVPVSYLGTHQSGGQTRASALVATEPVSKMFENRQDVYERIIQRIFTRLFSKYGIDDQVEITFPEIVTQDRSAKLKDLSLAVMEGWMTKERAATIAAKEFGVEEFEYDKEQADIVGETPAAPAPLSQPAEEPGGDSEPSAITDKDRRAVAMNNKP